MASVALAGLESARSEAMIALADLDQIYAAARIDGSDWRCHRRRRDRSIGWIGEEDRVLAACGAGLAARVYRTTADDHGDRQTPDQGSAPAESAPELLASQAVSGPLSVSMPRLANWPQLSGCAVILGLHPGPERGDAEAEDDRADDTSTIGMISSGLMEQQRHDAEECEIEPDRGEIEPGGQAEVAIDLGPDRRGGAVAIC